MPINMLNFFKSNLDISIALILAVISTFVVSFDIHALVEALNLKVLLLLFCLMIVIASARIFGLLDYVYKKCFVYVKNTRQLCTAFIFLNFFISMIVTNDVSLIIFVPLAISVLTKIKREDLIIKVVCLQTIAANMGSTLTPIGNPQNLFIYTYFNYNLQDFLKVTAPICLVCFVMLYLFTLNIDKGVIDCKNEEQKLDKKSNFTVGILFLLCILAVLSFINVYLLTLIVVLSIALLNLKLFKEVDYKLLLLFVLLFIFVGNISRVEFIVARAELFVKTYEYFVSVSLSQIISNVPTTLMLSSFCAHPDKLLVGVNVGGLGTIIASMASLISFKAYVKVPSAKPLYYLKKFTKYNLHFLLVLVVMHFLLPNIF